MRFSNWNAGFVLAFVLTGSACSNDPKDSQTPGPRNGADGGGKQLRTEKLIRNGEVIARLIYERHSGKWILSSRITQVGGDALLYEFDEDKDGTIDQRVFANPKNGDIEAFHVKSGGEISAVSEAELFELRQTLQSARRTGAAIRKSGDLEKTAKELIESQPRKGADAKDEK
jgi:hypothetical protein